ncbi:hypothetical protein ABZP36_005854 [Zizania latifolia]
MELSGDPASPAPEPHGQPEEGRSPRGAELFEDAVEGSSTASVSPVARREGEDAAEAFASSPLSASRPLAGDEPATAEEVETYEPPSASASGLLATDGDESPSVFDTGSAASPSVSPSEQRARVAEEHENSIDPASPVGAGSPAREETKSRISSAPSSPVLSGTSTSSSPPLSQIKRQVRHVRSGSFQRFRQQIQREWKWGTIGSGGGAERSPREQLLRTTVNIEAMANQKRQWYQIHSKARDHKQYKEPTALFEHFLVVGLHSYANVGVIEDAFAKKKSWESDVAHSEILDLREVRYRGPIPTMEPQPCFLEEHKEFFSIYLQILFKYPPAKRAEIRESDLPSFCFPEGVKARIIERTPSISDLNEAIFGQEHLCRDDLSFIFSMKVSDNAPLYGVCLHVQEIVQRAPGILGMVSPLNPTSYKPSHFLVSAPRCYCLLTRLPFFELHYEMLNSIIAQERLDRITQFASEIALVEPVPCFMKEQNQVNEDFESSNGLSYNDWTEYAVPVNSMSGLVSSSGLQSEGDVPSYSFRSWEPNSPESILASET